MTMQKNEENWRRQQKSCLDRTESHRMILQLQRAAGKEYIAADNANPNPAPSLASET